MLLTDGNDQPRLLQFPQTYLDTYFLYGHIKTAFHPYGLAEAFGNMALLMVLQIAFVDSEHSHSPDQCIEKVGDIVVVLN